jgi:YgiT-type zinc finger domain-containing protein
MRCAICRTGHTHPGTADEALTHHGTTLVVKNVPAEICDQCGETYLDSDTTAKLLDLARAAAQAGVEVDIRHYAA